MQKYWLDQLRKSQERVGPKSFWRCTKYGEDSLLIDDSNGNGLEELEFINTKPWERNPDKGNTIFVDAYEFRTLNKLGYIAFMRNNKTMKWLIKSFHLSDNKNPVMLIAMQRAGLLGKYKEKSWVCVIAQHAVRIQL